MFCLAVAVAERASLGIVSVSDIWVAAPKHAGIKRGFQSFNGGEMRSWSRSRFGGIGQLCAGVEK